MRPLTATSLALALMLGGAAVVAPAASQAQIGVGVGVSVGVAPPPLPYYEQPPAPGYGYIWTPGYWGWNAYVDDYYWVPGTWVLPPSIGFLWTPPWWGWQDGAFVFNAGYWGPFVGFYGGINYGFGYTGFGYEGGYWRGNNFYYNRTVNNIRNVNTNNVYSRPVTTVGGAGRSSFNGPGGAQARPTAQQLSSARAPHLGATAVQQQHSQMASAQSALRAGVNHGAPPIAATSRAAVMRGSGVTPAARAGGAFHAAATPGRAPGAAGVQRYGQASAAGAQRAGGAYQTAHRAAPQAAQRYSSNTYHAPARASGGYRAAPHPSEAFHGGGFRSAPQAMARSAAPAMREAAARPAAGGREPGRR